MCDGRIEVMQGVKDEPYKFCPYCGMSVVRVISKASIKVNSGLTPEKAAQKGFSTFKKSGKGVWEKVAGPEGGPSGGKEVVSPGDFEEK